MAARDYTVSGASIAALLGWTHRRGIDLSDVVTELGLARVDLAEPELRVPARLNDALWSAAVTRAKDPSLGLRFAEALDLDAFHLVGHLATSSATVGEAIDRVVAFSRLLHDAGRTELEVRRDRALLYPGCRGLPAPAPAPIAEFNAASAVMLVRFIVDDARWAPRSVAFRHAAPADARPHRALFGCTVGFDANEDVIELSRADLARPVRVERRTRVGRYLEQYARSLLASLPPQDETTTDRVHRVVVAAIGPDGPPSFADVAARLATSERTLQRRLSQEGTTFSAVVDQARRVLAERHLSAGTLGLTEIAFLLGFRDATTFPKAFRRWTGVTPGTWRKRRAAP